MQYSMPIRNGKLDVIETIIGPDAVLKIRTGTKPANLASADSGSVLATVLLPSDWMAPASGGSKSKSGTWEDLSADADGTAAHFRVYASDGSTAHIQGTVGTAAADMIVNSASFHTGQPFVVNSFTITDNNG